jgi:uncharacterized membrane protein YfcA
MATSLLIGIIFLSASFVQGLTGFGFALVALPFLTIIIDIKTAIPLCILGGTLVTSILAFQLKRKCDIKKIAPLFLGSIPGIIFGATLLKTIDSGSIRIFLGILLITYSLYCLKASPAPRNLHNRWSWFAGFFSGSLGAAFSVGGPPTLIYTTVTGWDKDEIKATLTGFFLASAVLIAITHALSGLTTSRVINHFLWSVPFIITGTGIGVWFYKLLPEGRYLKLIYWGLTIMGMVMILGK